MLEAIEYDCQRKFREAELRATAGGACPLGKWTIRPATRTLILLFHAPKWPERLQWCQRTWLADAAEIGQQVFVVIASPGIGETKLRGNELRVDVPDTLLALPQQVRAACHWALARDDWEYVFKCDDDTYISMPRFAAYRPGADYVGGWCRYGGETYAHGGGGYFLSRLAAEIVANELSQPEGPEDLLVGRVLRNAGIVLQVDKRFVGWGNWLKRPRRENAIVTTHSKTPGVHYASHAEAGMHGPGPLPMRKPRFEAERRRMERTMLRG